MQIFYKLVESKVLSNWMHLLSFQAQSAPSKSIVYQVMPQQISDISFLGQKASALCQNIPTYHAVPDCDRPASNKTSEVQTNNNCKVTLCCYT